MVQPRGVNTGTCQMHAPSVPFLCTPNGWRQIQRHEARSWLILQWRADHQSPFFIFRRLKWFHVLYTRCLITLRSQTGCKHIFKITIFCRRCFCYFVHLLLAVPHDALPNIHTPTNHDIRIHRHTFGSWLTCCSLSGTGPQSESWGVNHLDQTVFSIHSAGFSHTAHGEEQHEDGKNHMTTSYSIVTVNTEILKSSL